MANAYAYEMPDGSVAVIHIAPKCPLTPAEILAKDLPQGVTATEITPGNMPSSKRFRKSWKIQANAIEEDIPKARDVIRDELRIAREPEFKKADAEFLQAIEDNNKPEQQRVATLKQALRDAPAHPSIDLANTIQALSVIKLADLI